MLCVILHRKNEQTNIPIQVIPVSANYDRIISQIADNFLRENFLELISQLFIIRAVIEN